MGPPKADKGGKKKKKKKGKKDGDDDEDLDAMLAALRSEYAGEPVPEETSVADEKPEKEGKGGGSGRRRWRPRVRSDRRRRSGWNCENGCTEKERKERTAKTKRKGRT